VVASRVEFDAALLHAARQAGRRGTCAGDVRVDADGVTLETRAVIAGPTS
jgi:hypothetical protein